MYPLIQKEWLFIKPLIIRFILLGLPVFLTVLFLSSKLNPEGIMSSLSGGLGFMMVYSFVFQAGYQEDKIGGLNFLRSLPISCNKIVGAKFLIIALLSITALLMALIILYLSGLTDTIPPDTLNKFLPQGLASLASVLIVGSVMLWTFFRFGYNKMGMALLITFIVLPLLFIAISLATLQAFPGIYVVFSETNFVAIMLLVAAVVFGLGLFDSIRALKGKDFS